MAGYALQNLSIGRFVPMQGNGVLSSAQEGSAVTRINGAARRARFTVHDHATNRPVDGGISNADGSWSVSNLNPDRFYFVRVVDRSGQLNGAVLDWLKPTTESVSTLIDGGNAYGI